ncbi:MAG TPA: hypothetical protein VFT50_00940 [Baekduia sp.]|nr:hypothetical protein [Baekduia sp.]
MTALELMAVTSAIVAGAGVGAGIALRPRLRQDAGPARTLTAIGIAVALLGVGMGVATGVALAAVPTLAIGALCLAAGWALHPTQGSRFAEFERAFRAYADRHVHHRP